MRNFACLWSRELETNASLELSELHSLSSKAPEHEMSSHNVPRRASGGIFSSITLGPSRSMITLLIMIICLSVGSGYFQASSLGAPTLVVTRYISLTLRWSWRNVAIFFESGDHNSIG